MNKVTDTKFTVGSFWRSRDNRKHQIIYHAKNRFMSMDISSEIPVWHSKDGSHFTRQIAGWDLMEPWREPINFSKVAWITTDRRTKSFDDLYGNTIYSTRQTYSEPFLTDCVCVKVKITIEEIPDDQ